jgi:mono/diheme cytochrome c family protein
MPRRLLWPLVITLLVSWVPFALIGRARSVRSTQPPVHLIPDMDDQPKYEPQERNLAFADLRAMRPVVTGTVARGELRADSHLATGKTAAGQWATGFPVEVDAVLMQRGQTRFNTYCSPCHGISGEGDGLIARRADRLAEGTWTPPTSMHTDLVRGRPEGQLFNTISHGIRNMPAYGPQIPVEDRWAIVAYVRALQRTQTGTIDDVPEPERARLR